MPTFSRIFIASLAAVLTTAGSTVARTPTAPIVVWSSDMARQHWARNISDALTANLRYPLEIGRSAAEGLVTVTFRCGEDGKPTEILVPRSSGNDKLDLAAERAVAKLPSLHPLPAGIVPDQLFVANIVFATDVKQTQRWLRSAGRPNALAGSSARPLMLAVAAVR